MKLVIKKYVLNLISSLTLVMGSLIGNAQITINGNQTANILAQTLVGSGVTISNPVLDCPSNANGYFVVTPPNISNLGLDSGIVLTSGQAATTAGTQGANGPASGPSTSNGNGGDADLTALIGGGTFDKCILEFDFVPLGDTVKFDYVFGSSEYPSFTCSNFNDVFGFFISGPGFLGPYTNNAVNIALVPGSTTCPVGVSTIYCPNQPGCCNTTNNNCFNLTPGCTMFNATNNTCAYFVCNTGGTSVNYQGFTVPLTALAVVQPCSTYHLKLAIADKGDQILDSGVFLKAGSLSSNSITFTPVSNLSLPVPYIIEGCAPGYIKVRRPVATSFPYTINYQLGGTATHPADYTVGSVPAGSPLGQVTIPANDTVAFISITALQDMIGEPLEEVKVYQLAPCSNDIVDSVSLFISDTIQMNIITPDTAICKEDTVHFQVFGDDSLQYTWSPITNITNPNIKEPSASPNVTTDYILCATLPNSGCTPKCDTVRIIINEPPNVFIGNDTIICNDTLINFNPIITPVQTYTYTWSGSGNTFLGGNTNILNPTANINQVGTFQFILQVDPIAVGCEGEDTMTVQVLPSDIILHNGDTTVCQGATIPINVTGHPLFSYVWTPSTYLNNPFIEDPTSVPDSVVNYTVTATFPGCFPMTKSFNIDVQPVPTLYAGPDREICKWDTVQMHATVSPSWYQNYSYTWSPNVDLINGNSSDPTFVGLNSTNFDVIVSTPIGCADSDQVSIVVHPTNFTTVSPLTATICPRGSVQLLAAGAISYNWTPDLFLNDNTIPNPIASPEAPMEYILYSVSQEGCTDTDKVRIDIASDGVIDAGEDVTLYPGESYNLNATGNCVNFTWTPNYHLSATNIKNPVANPPVTTQYVVTGTTEYGCATSDTITIRISDESILDLPNVFSPGSGTSVNDELKIIKRGIFTLNFFRVYNRWGELVFETTDIEKGWNGRYQGKPQPMGAYVYVLDAKSSTGKRITKQGNVTLIR